MIYSINDFIIISVERLKRVSYSYRIPSSVLEEF